MADDFHARAAKGEAFASAIQGLLQSDQIIRYSQRAGIERSDLAAFMAEIRNSLSAMERRLRFNPDGLLWLIGRGLAHWEAKASIFIERTPYEYYLQYEQRGEPVLLFICPRLLEGGWRPVLVGRLKDVVLEHGQETENRWNQQGFPPRPVDQDGWIHPRNDPRGTIKGSGTPFRKIDYRRSKMLGITEALLDNAGYCKINLDLLIGDTIQRTYSVGFA
jgi:hypothetical protein